MVSQEFENNREYIQKCLTDTMLYGTGYLEIPNYPLANKTH